MKLKCPKCGNETFKISITEKHITQDDLSGITRLKLIKIMNITCARCGWNTHFTRREGRR